MNGLTRRRLVLAMVLLVSIPAASHAMPSRDVAVMGLPALPLVVTHDQTELHAAEGLVYHRGRPFNGAVVDFYPNGRLARRSLFRRGKKHGLVEQWFDNGSPSFSSAYRDGRQQGETRTWWRNGNLRSVARFDDGVAHGVQEQWYASGAKFKRIQLEHGRESGRQQSWRENGSIYNNYEARDGRIYGLKRSKLCYRVDEQEVQVVR